MNDFTCTSSISPFQYNDDPSRVTVERTWARDVVLKTLRKRADDSPPEYEPAAAPASKVNPPQKVSGNNSCSVGRQKKTIPTLYY